MIMSQADHEKLEDWARKYGFLACSGFLFSLLCAGKLSHRCFSSSDTQFLCGYIVCPAAVLGGFYGMLCLYMLFIFDTEGGRSLQAAMQMVQVNLPGFTFASLILGLVCARTSSQHQGFKATLLAIFHEGMPMTIAHQVLTWGQTAVCLLICGMAR
jgi:hypothetical protein